MTHLPLIELHYLPNISYLSLLTKYGGARLEAMESFTKQTYRNRCYLLGANQVERLTIPVVHTGGHQLVSEVQIDYRTQWQDQHWRTIRTAYGKAPFFEDFGEPIKAILYQKHPLLFDLNRALLTFCLHALQLNLTICPTTTFAKPHQDTLDWRNCIHPKKKSVIPLPNTYWQVFGNSFVHDMSVVDLLFCEGPSGQALLKANSLLIKD